MGDHANELQANDPVSGRTVWRVEWPTANYTPVMATAGDLVFQGGSDQRVFRAFDARTGDIVWTFRGCGRIRCASIPSVPRPGVLGGRDGGRHAV